MYGHLVWIDTNGKQSCVTIDGQSRSSASACQTPVHQRPYLTPQRVFFSRTVFPEPYEGQVPKLGDCSYEDSKTAQSNQYWNFQNYEGQDAILYFRGPPECAPPSPSLSTLLLSHPCLLQ